MIAQKMIIGGQPLGERHRAGADGVAEQAEHVRPLAPERGRRSCSPIRMNAADTSASRAIVRLHAAGRGVEVFDDRGDRNVHQGRIDDQHEHGRGEEDREALIALGLDREAGGEFLGHQTPTRVTAPFS